MSKFTEKEFKALFDKEDDPAWFIALWDAEDFYECNRIKDWAYIIHEGVPAYKDIDVQEWLNDMAESMEDDEEGDSLLDMIIANMQQWGFAEK